MIQASLITLLLLQLNGGGGVIRSEIAVFAERPTPDDVCEAAFRHWFGSLNPDQRPPVVIVYVPDSFREALFDDLSDSPIPVRKLSERPVDTGLPTLAQSSDYTWSCELRIEDETGTEISGVYSCGMLCGSGCRYRAEYSGSDWAVQRSMPCVVF